eukprot:424493_1
MSVGWDTVTQLEDIDYFLNLDPPTEWWTDANDQVIYERYGATQYAMSRGATRNHNLLSYSRDTDFDWTSNSYKTETILTGIIFIALGIVLLIVIPVVAVLVRNLNCCCRATKKSPPRESKVRIFAFIALLISIGGIAISAVGTVRVNSDLNTTDSNLYDSAGLFAVGPQVLYTATDIVHTSTSDYNTVLDTFQSCANQKSYYTQTIMDNLRSQADANEYDLESIINTAQLLEANSVINDVLTYHNKMKDSETWRTVSIWCIFAACVIIEFVIGMVFVKIYTQKPGGVHVFCCFKCISSSGTVLLTYILGAIMVLGACCLAGATFVFSMMGGDFCVDPDVYSTQIVDLTSSGTTYYLNCQTPYPVYYEQVTDLLNSTAMLSESIMASKTQYQNDIFQVEDNCTGPLYDGMDKQNGYYYGGFTAVELGASVLKCEPINVAYEGLVYNDLCTTWQDDMFLLFIGTIILLVSLTALLILWTLMMAQIHAYELKNEEPSTDSLVDAESVPAKSGTLKSSE